MPNKDSVPRPFGRKAAQWWLLLLLGGCASAPPTQTHPQSLSGRILIEDFEFVGPSSEAWMAAGLRATVLGDMGRIPGLQPITSEAQNRAIELISERRRAGEEVDVATETARILAAEFRCTATLQNVGRSLRLQIRLLQAPEFRIARSATIDGTLDHPADFRSRVVEQLAGNFDRKLSPEERQDLTVFSPKNGAAYEAYARGAALAAHDPAAASVRFREALALEPDYLDAMNYLAIVRQNLGDYPGAAEMHRRRLELLERLALQRSEEYATTQHNLASVYADQGRSDEALSLYVRANQLRTSVGQVLTPHYGATLQNIATILVEQGRGAAALKILEADRRISEQLGMTETPGFAITLSSLGTARRLLRDSSGARANFEAARALLARLRLQRTGEYAGVLNNLGTVDDDEQKWTQALQRYTEANRIRAQIGRAQTRPYAATLHNQGSALRALGRAKEALAAFQQERSLLEKLRLGDTEGYGLCLAGLALAQLQLKQPCVARANFALAVALFERHKSAHLSPARRQLLETKDVCK